MKAPGFDFSSLSFVSKARKFFKKRNADGPSRRDYKGISFSNEVYQETCKPVKNGEENSIWRNPLTVWQKHLPSKASAVETTSPRTSIRSYKYPWGEEDDGESTRQEEKNASAHTLKDEGIFVVELVKPHYGYLGLVLVGGADTPLQKHYVKDIIPDSIASRSGSVRIGDELIEVNGHTLRGRTHSAALVVIRSLPPVIRILIERTKDGNKAILSSFSSGHAASSEYATSPDSGDPDITSPKARSRKRSIIQVANDSSIIKKSVSSVIDVTMTLSPLLKPAKLVRRESRCTSFIGVAGGDDNDVMSATSCKGENMKDEGVDEESNDYDDRLSMLSNTSEWCARQMSMFTSLQDSVGLQNDDVSDVTSTFSMSTLSESLSEPCTEEVPFREDNFAPHTTPLDQCSIRDKRVLTESIIEVDSDEDEENVTNEPAMFLRRGSLRARGSLTLRRASCIEHQEDSATWPTSTRRQRASLNWDTFVPPPEKPVRRSDSVCVRPSSMYANNVPNRFRGKHSDQTTNRMVQRSNSTGKYIDKRTLRTKVYRKQNTEGWGFSIAGGTCSPYGDLPIHILEIETTAGGESLLKKGDEIVSFGVENFENITFLEADRKMKNFEGNCAIVIVKRKYLYRNKTQVCNTFAQAWNEQAKQGRRVRQRSESFYY